jgi:hypothetical protein
LISPQRKQIFPSKLQNWQPDPLFSLARFGFCVTKTRNSQRITMFRCTLPFFLVLLIAKTFAYTLIGNGKIYTVNEANPWVDAIAVNKTGTIVAIGTQDDIRVTFGKDKSEYWDLDGRMMIPGFQDAHLHAVEPESMQIFAMSKNIPTSMIFLTILRIALVVENLVERAVLLEQEFALLFSLKWCTSLAMTTPSRFWMMPTPTLQFSF